MGKYKLKCLHPDCGREYEDDSDFRLRCDGETSGKHGPAAAVAVDALRQAVLSEQVKRDEKILLHITGGGKEIQYSKGAVYQVQPSIEVNPVELDRVIDKIGEPMRISNTEDILKKYE